MLTNTNVYDNLGQQGGGLSIMGTAMLTNTNVYANLAPFVRSPSELSLRLHPLKHMVVLLAGRRALHR